MKFTKSTKSRTSKKAKTAVLEFWDSPKLISCKIIVIGKSWNFHTVISLTQLSMKKELMKITCKDWLILVPLQDKIDSIHESVIRGNMREVRGHLDKRGWANARDHYGHSPLHKSVMANQEDIMKFILRLYPDHIEDRDNVSMNTQCRNVKIFCEINFGESKKF